MTDREMLELAAKAGGYARHEYVENSARDGRVVTGHYDSLLEVCINPLTNDGDALRLQAALRFSPEFGNDAVTIWPVKERYTERPDGVSSIEERCAATRRAITRAAAEVGRQMKTSND